MEENQQSEPAGTVVHVSPAFAIFIFTIIITLVGVVYGTLTSSIASVKADDNVRISAVEQSNASQAATVNKISTNVAIMCATLNAHCQQ